MIINFNQNFPLLKARKSKGRTALLIRTIPRIVMSHHHSGQGFPTSWDEFFAIKRKTIDKMNKRTQTRGGKRHWKATQSKSKPNSTSINDPWDIRLVVCGNVRPGSATKVWWLRINET